MIYRAETSGDVAKLSGVAYRIIDTCQLFGRRHLNARVVVHVADRFLRCFHNCFDMSAANCLDEDLLLSKETTFGWNCGRIVTCGCCGTIGHRQYQCPLEVNKPYNPEIPTTYIDLIPKDTAERVLMMLHFYDWKQSIRRVNKELIQTAEKWVFFVRGADEVMQLYTGNKRKVIHEFLSNSYGDDLYEEDFLPCKKCKWCWHAGDINVQIMR